MKNEYTQFLESKKITHQSTGIDSSDLNNKLKPFQAFIVDRALKAGKYAIFADCGLGKTFMQIEWARVVTEHTGKPVLILAPLAVKQQTINEGSKFGIYIEELKSDVFGSGIFIENYDQIENIDCSQFSGVVLDESSILKNFTGKLKEKIIDSFKYTQFKLACTATPSPNDPVELGNHSEFLDVMSRNEMLSMYFVHDGGQTSKWRLKGHAIKEFYRFVAEWSIMMAKPSDIGFDDTGYCLKSLNYIESVIETDKRDNGELFNSTAVSATYFNKELRYTIKKRMDKVADLVNSSDESFIVWVKQNEEADYIKKLIPGSIEVRGSDDKSKKESLLVGFGRGEFRVLITKTKIAQFGLNYQNCNNQVFASLDFSFEGLYQAIRRSYRFGQDKDVNIHIISTDTMTNVIENIKEKQIKFEVMQKEMSKHTNEQLKKMNKQTFEVNEEEYTGDDFKLLRGDCCKRIKEIESESIDFSVFSPPFSELYTYSNHTEDMGNSKNYEEFCEHFKFLVDDLYRVLKPGRNIAIHCMDLPIQKGKEGFIGLRDFSGMLLKMFGDAGFIYHSRVTIWKDPVVEMQRTKALGLLHKQVKKDSTMSRVGIPDYILVFRKDGERNDPVRCEIDVDTWQKYASPVWMDIKYGNTLNGSSARENDDEKHICPLQLDTIKRLVNLYTNKGDTVFTPFMGIGSEVFQSLEMGRKGIGIELKESYYNLAKSNIDIAMNNKNQMEMF